MTADKKQAGRKTAFPTGIFLLLFLIQIIASTAGITFYFYTSSKNSLADIEKYTLNYSKTLAEAFASVAELSYKDKNYSSLKSLFREKIEENTIDEAFFVLKNGSLIVHSNTTIEKKLRGNIANDEMSYNLELILQPVEKNSKELFFSNYNIINKKIPFNRSIRELIQKHLYTSINTSGWLFTKGVFFKNEPVGTVNFIVNKERIYSSIFAAAKEMKKIFTIALIASFFIAMIIALIIMFRLKKNISVQEFKSSGNNDTPDDFINEEDREIILEDDYSMELPEISDYPQTRDIDDLPDFEISFDEDNNLQKDEKDSAHIEANEGDEYITIELLGEIDEEEKTPHITKSAGTKIIASVVIDEGIAARKNIPDAIPVRKEN
ncbi:MAG: hypothetical protein WDA74_00360 [Spirochaetota bacterium]